MATAIVKTEKKTVTKEVPQKVVTLELTPKEASVLKTLVGRVGGDSPSTNRRHTNAVLSALASAGVQADDCCHFSPGTIVARWASS